MLAICSLYMVRNGRRGRTRSEWGIIISETFATLCCGEQKNCIDTSAGGDVVHA